MIKTLANNIYIVMYHYVREIKNSKYPNLKGLEFSEFKNQINYFKKNFNILDNEQFCEILELKKKIPKKNSILLSFDDGYVDHYNYVFPYLKSNKLSGLFYPTVNIIKNNSILDVNKIHFILEKEQNRNKIINLIFYYLKKFSKIKTSSINFSNVNLKSRWDDKKTVMVKRLLQFYLPKKLRNKIINKIFKKIIGIEEKQFSKKIYLNTSQILEMHKNSMIFGSHGCEHSWLEHLSKKKQSEDIINSIKYFKKLDIYNKNFSFCYPYGSFNKTTIKLLKEFKIKFALTTIKGSIKKKNIKNRFILPRIDTNDFKR